MAPQHLDIDIGIDIISQHELSIDPRLRNPGVRCSGSREEESAKCLEKEGAEE